MVKVEHLFAKNENSHIHDTYFSLGKNPYGELQLNNRILKSSKVMINVNCSLLISFK